MTKEKRKVGGLAFLERIERQLDHAEKLGDALDEANTQIEADIALIEEWSADDSEEGREKVLELLEHRVITAMKEIPESMGGLNPLSFEERESAS